MVLIMIDIKRKYIRSLVCKSKKIVFFTAIIEFSDVNWIVYSYVWDQLLYQKHRAKI